MITLSAAAVLVGCDSSHSNADKKVDASVSAAIPKINGTAGSNRCDFAVGYGNEREQCFVAPANSREK